MVSGLQKTSLLAALLVSTALSTGCGILKSQNKAGVTQKPALGRVIDDAPHGPKQGTASAPASDSNSEPLRIREVSDQEEAPNEQVTINGLFSAKPSLQKAEDEANGKVLVLSAKVGSATFAPKMNDALLLARAASRNFISPPLKGCVLTDDGFGLIGSAQNSISFAGRDSNNATSCEEFLKEIQRSGFTIQYGNVPLQSGNGFVKTVIVNISAPK